MRLIFFGSGDFGLPTLEALCEGHSFAPGTRHEVVLVVTQPDRPAGRGKKTTPTPVRSWCDTHGRPVLATEDVNDDAVVARLLGTGARLGVVAAFGQKIGPRILDGLPGGCINLHASLLPRYRGASPIHRAILNGDAVSGVTVFRLVERMDAGPILTRAETFIGETETAGELHDRLATDLGPRAVLEAVAMFEDGAVPAGERQDESLASRAPKLKKADGIIDWSKPAAEVARRIHGMCPWPGATATFTSRHSGKTEPVTILRAEVVADAPAGEPGSMTDALEVRCGSGALAIREIKPAGSRAMAWRDFVNGRHVSPKDRFGVTPAE
jgi:methionyl-tRNA formyltransferase